MVRRLTSILAALTIVGLLISGSATAQDATPIAPAPELCTLSAPTFEDVARIAASPAPETVVEAVGTPTIDLPAGEPVDDATREAVEQSMIVNVACLNTGSYLLAMAVYSDDGLGRIIGGSGAIDQAIYDSLATPEAISEDQRTIIIEFQDMVLLPDGRVAAVIIGDNQADDSEPASATLFYLVEQDGHWYIDDFVNP